MEKDADGSPKENGERSRNGVAAVDSKSDKSSERQPDVLDDHPGKSRSTLHSCHTSVNLCKLLQIWYFIKS